ncbi:MAG: hypothetical protein K5650_00180 [Bacteroidales bacterium]|nr:hypothetical protein [Bacteroidales bacterium]
MKKLLLALFCLAAGTMAMAQGAIPVTFGQPADNYSARQAEQTIYLGEYKTYTCVAIRAVSSRGKEGELTVALVDGDMRIQRRVTIPNSKKLDLLSARLDHGLASLILVNSDDKKLLQIFTVLINVETMQMVSAEDLIHPLPVGLQELYRIELSRKDQPYYWAASSPDGAYAALVVVISNREKGEYTATEVCLDRMLNRVWEHREDVGSIGQLAVTNDGIAYSLGFETPAPGETNFTVCEMGIAGVSKYTFGGNMGEVLRASIINVTGGRLIAGGTIKSDKSTKKNDYCSGVFGLAFDLKSKALAGNISVRPFQNEDICVLTNKSTKKSLKQDYIKNEIEYIGSAPTSWGGAMAFGTTETRKVTDEDGIATETKYCLGIHIFAVGSDGTVMWTRNVRRNDFQVLDDIYLNAMLISSESEVGLLKCESPKFPATYNITKPAKKLRMGTGKNNLVCYRINRDGETTKVILATKNKLMPVGTPYPKADGGWWFLVGLDNKIRIGDIRLQ